MRDLYSKLNTDKLLCKQSHVRYRVDCGQRKTITIVVKI